MVRTHTTRTPLLLGAAGLAIATALASPSPAQAQAFQAAPEVISGNVTVDRSTPNVDTITVSSPTGVIDWFPDEDSGGNALTFLPTGATAIFQDAPGQGGFAILNRIMPATNGNIVVFDGTVISRLQDASGGFSSGGLVAFYSPTGILVGSTAAFDVGQLLLTTLDPDLASFDSFAGGGTLFLTGTSGATAGVTISSGASITAAGEGSFLAVAAPQITMSGTAYINGSTAYAAGEQVTLSYSNGLFDISIPVGTTVGNAIVHDGATGGPSSTGMGDSHAIYAVARENGNPVSMLLSGNLGFDPATVATVDNGDVILSAGYSVFGTTIADGGQPPLPTAVSESIAVDAASFTSSVAAGASDRFEAITTDGAIAFGDGLDVSAYKGIVLQAQNGFDLTVTGDTVLNAEGVRDIDGQVFGGDIAIRALAGSTVQLDGGLIAQAVPVQVFGPAQAGSILVEANGGSITVADDVLLFVTGNTYDAESSYGDQAGGIGQVIASSGGTVDLGGNLSILAYGIAGGNGGYTAAGGTAQILGLSSGQVTVAGDVFLDATAIGGDADGSNGILDGGSGFAGNAEIVASGGGVVVGGSVVAAASGNGGTGLGLGGTGQGGYAGVFVDGGGYADLQSDLSLVAAGRGGDGNVGGSAFGGFANVLAEFGSIAIAGSASQRATGTGGAASSGFGGKGGDGTGGVAAMQANASSGAASIAAAEVSLNVSGFGGAGGAGDGSSVAAGSGGVGTGGSFSGEEGSGGAFLLAAADGGTVAIAGSAYLSAHGYGGLGGSGGTGQAGAAGGRGVGGTAQAGTFFGTGDGSDGDGQLSIGEAGPSAGASNLFVESNGFGGSGGTGPAGTGDGGVGEGGAAFLTARSSSLFVSGSAIASTVGFGGGGSAGGDGIGGYAIAQIESGASVDVGFLQLNSLGRGGTGAGGKGGDASVFGVEFIATDSAIRAGTGIAVAGNALGGASTGGGDGGAATGASIALTVTNSTFDFATDGITSDLRVTASATGGSSSAGGGGTATGGAIEAGFANSAFNGVDPVEFAVDATGGNGALAGGDASGGSASLSLTSGTVFAAGGFDASANAKGGNGNLPGTATGGLLSVFVDMASRLTVTGGGLWSVDADGGASDDADAAAADGGIVDLTVDGGTAEFGDLLRINANGRGGDVLVGTALAGAGSGGTIDLEAANGGTIALNSLQAAATGIGGTGPSAEGGIGSGGEVYLTATGAGSSLTLDEDNSARFGDTTNEFGIATASGRGGATNGGSGIGGGGFGGQVILEASDGGAIALAADPASSPDSNGFNGLKARGYGGGSAVADGAGGAGQGGEVSILVDNGSFTSGDLLASSLGNGGNSLDTALDISGGAGSGGVRVIDVANGGTFVASVIGGGAGAIGGNGSGAGVGGDATGGLAGLLVDNATVTFAGVGSAFGGAQGGTGRIGGNATGGTVFFGLENGAVVQISPDAAGNRYLGLGALAAGGDGTETGGNAVGENIYMSIVDSSFDGMLKASATAVGGASPAGTGGEGRGGAIVLLADNSQIALLGGSSFSAGAFGGDGAVGGASFGGSVAASITNGSLLDVSGGANGISTVYLSADATGGTGADGDGDAQAGTAGLFVSGAQLDAPAVALSAVASSGTGSATGGGTSLSAETSAAVAIGLADLNSSATSEAGSAAGGYVDVAVRSAAEASIDSLQITADGQSISGGFSIAAEGGNLALTDLIAQALGNTAGEASAISADGGSLPISGAATIDLAGDLFVTTANGGLIGGPTVAAPTANIAITAGGTVTIAGDDDNRISFGGQSLSIRSRELDILPGARIGASFVSLSVEANDFVTVLGGAEATEGYTLTQDELSRIEAGGASFSSSFSGTASDDILIRDTTISGSLDDGTAEVSIDVGGVARVEGQLLYVDAASTDSLSIFAERLEIVTPGGIGIVDASGNPTGNFEFEGGDFWMADAETIARLQDNVDFEGRDALLATAAEGSADPLGYLRAGDVVIDIERSGLVRNTGTTEAPGGITVTGSLSFTGDGPEYPVDVVAYGRKQNADGTFVTGSDFFALVDFGLQPSGDDEALTYVEGSTFNDCEIGVANCGEEPPPEQSERDEVLEAVDDEAPVAAAVITTAPVTKSPIEQSEQDTDVEFGADFPGLLNAALTGQSDAIDDPVASGGDIALYGSANGEKSDDADDDDDDNDEDKVNEENEEDGDDAQ